MYSESVARVRPGCNNPVGRMVVSSSLREANIMDTHNYSRFDKERVMEFLVSVEFFLMFLVLISVLGFAFLAAV
jgi:hypothetical protein